MQLHKTHNELPTIRRLPSSHPDSFWNNWHCLLWNLHTFFDKCVHIVRDLLPNFGWKVSTAKSKSHNTADTTCQQVQSRKRPVLQDILGPTLILIQIDQNIHVHLCNLGLVGTPVSCASFATDPKCYGVHDEDSADLLRQRAKNFFKIREFSSEVCMGGVSTQQWPFNKTKQHTPRIRIALLQRTRQGPWLDAVTTPVEKKLVDSYVQKHFFFEGVQRPEKSPKNLECSDALLMSCWNFLRLAPPNVVINYRINSGPNIEDIFLTVFQPPDCQLQPPDRHLGHLALSCTADTLSQWLHLAYFGKLTGCWRNFCHSHPKRLLRLHGIYLSLKCFPSLNSPASCLSMKSTTNVP